MMEDRTEREAANHKRDGRAAMPVRFVSAGPGAADLLTLRAERALREADVIVHDSLVGLGALSVAPESAERFDCGSRRLPAAQRQETICRLLVEHARKGRSVVRLKGGDASLFGRLGEEMEFLRRRSIPYEVIPGVTAASAAAAAARIPLTHRDISDGVLFISAHPGDGKSFDTLDWDRIATANRTIAFYMGVGTIGEVRKRLLWNGASPYLPVAIVERASLPEERVVFADLDSVERIVLEKEIVSPALILVGQVAGLNRALVESPRSSGRTLSAEVAAGKGGRSMELAK